jgi:hypothetical protein
MVLNPARTQRQPPGTDQLMTWKTYCLWEDQKSHVLSDEEVADKKELQAACRCKEAQAARHRKKHNKTDKGRAAQQKYNDSYKGKKCHAMYAYSGGGRQKGATSAEAGQKRARPGASGELGGEQPACRAAEEQRATRALPLRPTGGSWVKFLVYSMNRLGANRSILIAGIIWTCS